MKNIILPIAFITGAVIGYLYAKATIEQQQSDIEKQAVEELLRIKDDMKKMKEEHREDIRQAVEEAVEEVKNGNMNEQKPYIISPEEWNGIVGYQKDGFSYYPKDDVLCDDEGNPVDFDVVGWENLDHLRRGEGQMYIRDDVHEIDYEIVNEEGSYKEEVLGIYDGDIDD